MYIGLFGGAFDPPHLGHLQFLKLALRLEFFDEIWLIPTFLPPLKMNSNRDSVAEPEERLAMVQLLINSLFSPRHPRAGEDRFSERIPDQVGNDDKIRVLDIEIQRGGKSYTIDTVRELKNLYPENKFFFLLGSDWVKDLGKWHKAEELFKEIKFISLPRTEINSSKIRKKIKNGESVHNLVPKEIEEYIKKHKLYI